MAERIEILLNGKRKTVPPGWNLEDLCRHLELNLQQVAIEVNRNIVKRECWSDQAVRAGDQIEIVHFVGGG